MFVIEGKRFRDSFLNPYSPARKDRNAGEEIEIEEEKENKEKASSVCPDDTRPPLMKKIKWSTVKKVLQVLVTIVSTVVGTVAVQANVL